MSKLTIDQELLDVALEALAKHNTKLGNLDTVTSEIKSEIAKRARYYKDDRKSLDNKLTTLQQDMVNSVKSEMSKIPIPADGKEGKHGKDGEDGKTGVDGRPGKDGLLGRQGPQGEKGEIGLPGLQGRAGQNGRDGKDGKSIIGQPGTGIKQIKANHNTLVIELDNGEVFDIKLPKAKEVPAGVTAMPTEIVVMRNLADTDIDSATDGQVLTKRNGKWVAETVDIPDAQPGDAGAIERRAEIESLFKVAQSTAYKELTYSNGDITNVDIYTNSGKATKLFSKIIGYNNGNISTVAITDEVNGGTLNKVMAYIDNNLSNITSTYTE